MMKCGSRALAQEFANKHGLLLGWSVLAPGWFVGTAEELRRIGVLNPESPKELA